MELAGDLKLFYALFSLTILLLDSSSSLIFFCSPMILLYKDARSSFKAFCDLTSEELTTGRLLAFSMLTMLFSAS